MLFIDGADVVNGNTQAAVDTINAGLSPSDAGESTSACPPNGRSQRTKASGDRMSNSSSAPASSVTGATTLPSPSPITQRDCGNANRTRAVNGFSSDSSQGARLR